MNKSKKNLQAIRNLVADMLKYFIMIDGFDLLDKYKSLSNDKLTAEFSSYSKRIYIKIKCYAYVAESLANQIDFIYERFSNYPFKNKSEIIAIKRIIQTHIDSTVKSNTSIIDDNIKDINDEKDELAEVVEFMQYLDKLYKHAEAILDIKHRQLLSAFQNEKHKNRPIFLSGLWGVFGSILGAVIGAAIGAWTTLYASGIITWPFK